MKTQISNLRSGTKNQITNPSVDYAVLPSSTSHVGHSGSSLTEVEKVWCQVSLENQESMKAIIKGVEVELIAKWSLSRKSVSYWANIDKDTLEGVFSLRSAKRGQPYISIQGANIVVVGNGQNSYSYICPSFVTLK